MLAREGWRYTQMREDKSCVRCVRKWYLKQSHNLFPTFLLFFLSFLRSFSFFLVSLVQQCVCVCVHYTYVLDRRTQANRRARIAINKIPLCNYVVTISTRMGRLFPEPLLCIKWEHWIIAQTIMIINESHS